MRDYAKFKPGFWGEGWPGRATLDPIWATWTTPISGKMRLDRVGDEVSLSFGETEICRMSVANVKWLCRRASRLVAEIEGPGVRIDKDP